MVFEKMFLAKIFIQKISIFSPLIKVTWKLEK